VSETKVVVDTVSVGEFVVENKVLISVVASIEVFGDNCHNDEVEDALVKEEDGIS